MSNVPAPGLVVFEAGKLMKKHFAPQTGWIAGRIPAKILQEDSHV